MVETLALGLRHALESGDCVLFLGAGIGSHLIDPDGNVAPDGNALARELAQHFSIECGDFIDLSKVAQIVQIRKGRIELETFLKKRLSDLEPDETLIWLTTLRWRAIFTTNYDAGIERAYARNPSPPQTPVAIAGAPDLVPFDKRFQVPIYYLHGPLFSSGKPRIIISENDYAEFRDQRRMIFEILKAEFATCSFLYIGYSNQDPNWKMLVEEMRAEFYPSQMPQSYRVAPHTDPLDNEILRSKNIDTLDSTFADFQNNAALAIAGSRVSNDTLDRIEATIPPELAPAFKKTPAAVARLLNSWEYVNQAAFNAIPNTNEFLRGDRANWALIAKRLQFERDLEEQIYDTLLDYITSNAKKPSTTLVLGPAGYGVTTLIMTIAARLVGDRAACVFMHRAGTPVIEGDIEFASALFDDCRPCFFIDNAADVSSYTHNSICRLRDLQIPAAFILGERLNEWRFSQGRLGGREFVLEPLSDPEILRLLQCLSAHGELGVLGDLPRDLQFSSIKQNYQKELLVAMREATEGKAFDAILEDEYRNIPNDLSRRLYMTVCCFYQHGAYVRDSLLADVISTPIVSMYSETSTQTEGVVIYEPLDPAYGHYSARARHRTIANVVWERCAEPGEREEIITRSLARLNLNYRMDAKAFEDFVRSDHLVDTIRTLEDRIHFFETACQKDPASPYVRQHYARMLMRSGQLNLAMGQVEEGLKISPDLRVLHHTKGVILAQQAIKLESPEIARRRLAQSEEEFRRCIKRQARDEYAYQSLAQLYVDWAKRSADPSEVTDYFAKAEAIINEGLRSVRVRDGLWIVSAEIQAELGNVPEYLRALERAVASTPGTVIGRYLLGRAYRKAGEPAKAIAILKPLIELHQDEHRAFLEYVCSMLALNESYARCIAVLRMSTLYGFSDPAFVATLGGMLFMNEEFSDAEAVFSESYKREFPAIEAHRIQFRPMDPKNPQNVLRLTGKVAAVKAGYAFIDAAGYPSFFCPSTRFGGIILQRGLKITFEPAFIARGPVADRLQSAP